MSSTPQDTPPGSRSPSAQSEDSIEPSIPRSDLGTELGTPNLLLHCHGQIWYLHRAPLSAKSGYFKKKEQEANKDEDDDEEEEEEEQYWDYIVVDVEQNVDPDVLWAVVEWCYHERLDINAQTSVPPAAQEETRLQRSMLLWAAAEELEVAGLKEALWAQAYSSAFFFDMPGPGGIISIAAVFRVIRTVYHYTPEPLTLALKIVMENMESYTETPDLAAEALVRATYGDGYEHAYRRKAMRLRHLLFRWLSTHFDSLPLPFSTFARDFDQFRSDVRNGQGKCPYCKQRWAVDLKSARISQKCSTCGARSTVDQWTHHEDIVFRNN